MKFSIVINYKKNQYFGYMIEKRWYFHMIQTTDKYSFDGFMVKLSNLIFPQKIKIK